MINIFIFFICLYLLTLSTRLASNDLLLGIRLISLQMPIFILLLNITLGYSAYRGHSYFSNLEDFKGIFLFTLLISTFSSLYGIYLALKIKFKVPKLIWKSSIENILIHSYIIVIPASIYIASIRGPLIFFAAYRDNSSSPVFGSFYALINFIFFIGFLSLMKKQKLKDIYQSKLKKNNFNLKRYYFVYFFTFIILVVYAELLRGARLEPMAQIIGILYIYLSYKTDSKSRLNSLKQSIIFLLIPIFSPLIKLLKLRSFLLYSLSGVFIIIFFIYLGIARHSFTVNIDLLTNLPELVSLIFDRTRGELDQVFLDIGTINQLSCNVQAAFYYVKQGMYKLTYLGYIGRLFGIGSNNFNFSENIYGVSCIGGFHEIGEAFLNFGVIGVIIIPFLISFLTTKVCMAISNSFGKFSSSEIIAVSFLSVCGRGFLYDSFALLRGFSIGFFGIFLLCLLSLLNGWHVKVTRS